MATEKKETKKTTETKAKTSKAKKTAPEVEEIVTASEQEEKIIPEEAPEIIEKPEEPKTYTVRTSSKLRVRKGPGFDFEIIRHLKNEDEVTALEEIDGWARIGENEWVCKDYLK